VKPEERILTLHFCRGFILALVHRGASRIEHIRAYKGDVEHVVRRLSSENFFSELRAAWPPWAAELLGLRSVDPAQALSPCWRRLLGLAGELCRHLADMLSEGEPDAYNRNHEPR